MTLVERLEIKPCETGDLDALEQAIPTGGLSRYHQRRMLEQLSHTSTYLIAWLDGGPVGHLNLRRRSGEPVVRARIGLVPEINALNVAPSLQNRGIGTALIAAAEAHAASRSASSIGLAVNVDNHAAQRLYARLGYVDWGYETLTLSWTSIDDAGTEHDQSEHCAYLVKPLTAPD